MNNVPFSGRRGWVGAGSNCVIFPLFCLSPRGARGGSEAHVRTRVERGGEEICLKNKYKRQTWTNVKCSSGQLQSNENGNKTYIS